MIDVMPQKLISKNDLNNWSFYSDNIERLKYVKKHLLVVFEYWIKNIHNPLSISWVQELFTNELTYLDKNLEELEKNPGENDLKNLLKELQNLRTKHSDEVYQKILSLEGEIFVFRELSKKYRSIKKIQESGDWEYNNTICSVKSLLCLDFNYRVIENTIKSLFFIKKNDVLRDYNYIRLGRHKKIDYEFREKIICFLEEDINDLLTSLTFLRHNYVLEGIKLRRDYRDAMQLKDLGYLLVDILECGNSKGIQIIIKEDRPAEAELNHQIEIILENDPTRKDCVSIRYDTDGYCAGDKIDPKFIEARVKEKVEEFDKSSSKVKNKNFEGWINISIHAMHEDYIKNNVEEMQQSVGRAIGSKDYKIHVVFQFGLNPMIFSFFKGVAQRS